MAKARRAAEQLVEENERLLAISLAEALTDLLTGLGNRRALLADLDAAPPERRELTLALFDLNGFKQYNDTFGHPAGDALLAGSATTLAGDDGPASAPRIAWAATSSASWRRSNGTRPERSPRWPRRPWPSHGDGFTIECAYGVASMPGDTTDADHALSLADQRMYEQKSLHAVLALGAVHSGRARSTSGHGET